MTFAQVVQVKGADIASGRGSGARSATSSKRFASDAIHRAVFVVIVVVVDAIERQRVGRTFGHFG